MKKSRLYYWVSAELDGDWLWYSRKHRRWFESDCKCGVRTSNVAECRNLAVMKKCVDSLPNGSAYYVRKLYNSGGKRWVVSETEGVKR